MLTDEQLEILSDTLTPLFQYLEKEVIADIARRIQKTLTYSRTAELKAISMRELGYSPVKIRNEAMKILNADADYKKVVAENTLEHKKKIKELLKNIEKELYTANGEVMSGAGSMAWENDLSVWEDAGKKLTDNSYLSKLVDSFSKQTKGEFKNLTQTTGFKTMSGYETLENTYRRELDKAVIKICSGTFPRDKVVCDVVHNLAQSGLRSIDFSSGYSMQLDTAARVALRTGCHQLAGKIMDKNIEQTGENLVYVSEHWGARNTGIGHANHEQWQGKVYFIKDGQDYSEEAKRIGQDRITSLYYATGYSIDGENVSDPLGLYGYNCRHSHYVWFKGVSSLPPKFPEPVPVVINGKTYDYYAVTQKMRSMERTIRALKREREAIKTLNMDTTNINAKIKRKTGEYTEFCEKCKVKDKTERLRYECNTSDLKKTKAWQKFQNTTFENDLKVVTLGASDSVGDGKEPVLIGQIDISKKDAVIEYFGEQIRSSETEKLYVIDKDGNVYYNEGVGDTVSIGELDLTDCTVLHNHPKSNGFVSFGEDDFRAIRDTEASEWFLVNEKYDYYAKKIKPMDKLVYNPYYLAALMYADEGEDFQHYIFECLKKEGYIEYVRKRVD